MSFVAPALAHAQQADPGAPVRWFDQIDDVIRLWLVKPLSKVFFFDLAWFSDTIEVPLVVAWLTSGALFLTFRFRFVNVRLFRHAISVTRGTYDKVSDPGEVTHFQALASALSGTVGLGNIAGVAVAVGLGGPGAVFWMAFMGVIGMSAKFAECTLGQVYRTVDNKGRVTGGPMRYLRYGLADLGFPRLGKVLAITFALFCMFGGLGGGNLFQANQSFAQFANVFPSLNNLTGSLVFGAALATVVGIVIVGGIRRIGRVTSVLVPMMCVIYVIAGAVVLIANAEKVPQALVTIVQSAFVPEAGLGAMVGSLIIGAQRAAFSNEAGLGSAAIAHSAAATTLPVREGIVALLEPFIDTIIVCTMTGLVVVVTGAHTDTTAEGIVITSNAFATVLPWFPLALSVVVLLFAVSTMITWGYYGIQCCTVVFGERSRPVFQVVYLLCVVLGCVVNLKTAITFADLMWLSMSFPNLIGVLWMSGLVNKHLARYEAGLRDGSIQPTRLKPER